jgi:archaellum component FlaC
MKDNHDQILKNKWKIEEFDKRFDKIDKTLSEITERLENIRLQVESISTRLKTEKSLEKHELTVRMWLIGLFSGFIFSVINIMIRFLGK